MRMATETTVRWFVQVHIGLDDHSDLRERMTTGETICRLVRGHFRVCDWIVFWANVRQLVGLFAGFCEYILACMIR